jgi:DNA helicase-2/ATP-dependent DNA helicase PcrA
MSLLRQFIKVPSPFDFLSNALSAKGREWKHVFVVRFNEGSLPLQSRPQTADDVQDPQLLEQYWIEEERRLAFVSISRAMQQLYISISHQDTDGSPLVPSRFLQEIPEKLMEMSSHSLGKRQNTEVTDDENQPSRQKLKVS